MKEKAICVLCKQPMPDGEEMFKYHGYSGTCPAPTSVTGEQGNKECCDNDIYKYGIHDCLKSPPSVTENEWEKESIRKFTNQVGYGLNPSNDTGEAVRLFRKALPDLLLAQRTHIKQALLGRVEKEIAIHKQLEQEWTGIRLDGKSNHTQNYHSIKLETFDDIINIINEELA